jgi:hypothetical protein
LLLENLKSRPTLFEELMSGSSDEIAEKMARFLVGLTRGMELEALPAEEASELIASVRCAMAATGHFPLDDPPGE